MFRFVFLGILDCLDVAGWDGVDGSYKVTLFINCYGRHSEAGHGGDMCVDERGVDIPCDLLLVQVGFQRSEPVHSGSRLPRCNAYSGGPDASRLPQESARCSSNTRRCLRGSAWARHAGVAYTHGDAAECRQLTCTGGSGCRWTILRCGQR